MLEPTKEKIGEPKPLNHDDAYGTSPFTLLT